MEHRQAVLWGVAGAAPSAALAVSEVLGLLNVFVGLMIVAAALFFFGGLITWFVLLGQIGRVQGIQLMEWGVVILFTLALLLAIVQFFQNNPAATTFVVSTVVVCGVAWMVLKAMQEPAVPAEKK